ncbi:hypothetical protein [Abyssalbus ytuae]|uniref:Uncharacterized protein n=1 Tax=Abyssalbus ytuae TaxID=2926907 RepID=A0A9E6ZMK2_9FLAO|nr:hypothetical protein [Abyssalbus ytuae]UOB18587.1 hypothetical protein MQE35_04685 [Abyssalbus ytuae]
MAKKVISNQTKEKVKKTVSKAAEATKEVAKKTGEYASKNPKTTLYIVGGTITIIALYGLFKGLKKTGDTLSGENIDENIEIDAPVNNSKTTISKQQAKQYASQLLIAFNWTVPVFNYQGTDTNVIKEIFKKINPEDFKLIYNEFGLKHYNGFGSPPENIAGGIQDLTGIAKKRDLVYWLKSELNSILDATTYKLVKNIVEQAGFVFA